MKSWNLDRGKWFLFGKRIPMMSNFFLHVTSIRMSDGEGPIGGSHRQNAIGVDKFDSNWIASYDSFVECWVKEAREVIADQNAGLVG